MENLESRVTDLEIQICHQIRMLEELNSVILSQQKKIESIENINSFLLQNVNNSAEGDSHITSAYINQKPPHY